MPGPEDYQIVTLYMIDDQHGWGVFTFGERRVSKNTWLGRTSDGGLTWINITPPWFEAFRSNSSFNLRSGFLKIKPLDIKTAWAYTSCTGWPLCDILPVIWRTEDGGSSWDTLNAPTSCRDWTVDCIPSSFQIVDRLNGWMFMNRHGRHYLGWVLYHTRDGGETYKEVTLPPPEGAIDTGLVNRPIFIDAELGFQLPKGLILEPLDEIRAGRVPRMRTSKDGGQTWQIRLLPMPEGLLETLDKIPEDEVRYLSFVSSFQELSDPPGVLGFLTSFSTRDHSKFFHAYYFSIDQGRSWHALSMVGDSFFLNAATGWKVVSTDPPGLEQTNDGGRTWQMFPQESWETDSDPEDSYISHMTDWGSTQTVIETQFFDDRLWPGQGLRLESLHMETATEGWGMEAGGSMLCTQDGARTWQPCPPPDEGPLPAEMDLPRTRGNWSPDQPFSGELFHDGAVPALLQPWIENSRQFLKDVDEWTNPFIYYCNSQDVERTWGSRIGIHRRCFIDYPMVYGDAYEFHFGYWIYHYYMLFNQGEQRIWPNVVSMDFINDQVGWRLLDLQTGLFRLDKTEDHGQTWSPVKTVAWMGELDFVNELVGWTIARQPPERGVPDYLYNIDLIRPASLLHTTDGGQTWQEITPVVGP
jgi:photosystem II stability/assembly factor-like uncharacterized protein